MKTLILAVTLSFLSQAICQNDLHMDAQKGLVNLKSVPRQSPKMTESESLNEFKTKDHQNSFRANDGKKIRFNKEISPIKKSSGGVDAGGGHTVSCVGDPVVTLDFFNALLAANSKVIDPEQIDVEKFFMERLKRVSELYSPSEHLPFNPEVGLKPYQPELDFVSIDRKRISDRLQSMFATLGPVDVWPDRDLKIIMDHNLIYNLPQNCNLQQAAAQDQEGIEVKFYQNSNVTQKLSRGQKEVLRLHEALYYLVRSYLGTDSKPVRVLLETFLLESPSDEMLIKSLVNFQQSLMKMGQKYVCEATLYREHTYQTPMGINLRPMGHLKVYGRTKLEAAEKIYNFSVRPYKFCNKVRAIDYFYAICEETASISSNCYENQ